MTAVALHVVELDGVPDEFSRRREGEIADIVLGLEDPGLLGPRCDLDPLASALASSGVTMKTGFSVFSA